MDGNFGNMAAYITPYDKIFKFCRSMLCVLPKEQGMFPSRLLIFISDFFFPWQQDSCYACEKTLLSFFT